MLYETLAWILEFIAIVAGCSLVFGGLVWIFAVVAFPVKLGNDR